MQQQQTNLRRTSPGVNAPRSRRPRDAATRERLKALGIHERHHGRLRSFPVYMDPGLYRALKLEADSRGVTLHRLLHEAIRDLVA